VPGQLRSGHGEQQHGELAHDKLPDTDWNDESALVKVPTEPNVLFAANNLPVDDLCMRSPARSASCSTPALLKTWRVRPSASLSDASELLHLGNAIERVDEQECG
jgi:hypothetical protein